MKVLVLSLLLTPTLCLGEWKEQRTLFQADTASADTIAAALSQHFQDLQHFLSAEEMVTPGDIQILSIQGQVKEYQWKAPEGCPEAARPVSVFAKSNASYVKNSQTWHVAIIPNLTGEGCSEVSHPRFLVHRIRLN